MVTPWKSLPYEITLPVFQGPLDLLLHLIEREELDISVVSLAQVTEQYLAYLSRLEELEAGVLADFLVVAARLILLKSWALLPKPPSPDGDGAEEDPGEELVRQLQLYRRFKAVAEGLRERECSGLRAYVRMAPLPAVERRLNLDGVSLADLVAAMQAVLAEKPPAEPAILVQPLVITIHDKIALIRRRFQQRPEVRFQELLEEAANRVEIVVTLLAVLELIKRQKVIAEQPRLFGEILIRPAPGVDLASFDDVSANGSEPEPVAMP